MPAPVLVMPQPVPLMAPDNVAKPLVLFTWKIRLVGEPVLSRPTSEISLVKVRSLVPPNTSVWLLVPLGYWSGFAIVRALPYANTVPAPVTLGSSGATNSGPVPMGPEVTVPTVGELSAPKPRVPVVG